jgi:hypothetical protein
MRRLLVAVLGLALVLAAGGELFGQDKDKKADDKDGPTVIVVPAKIPSELNKLGLSPSQKQRMNQILAKYHGKIAELNQKIKELRAEEREEMEKVLTDAQRARLRERGSEGSVPAKDKTTSKTEEKKADDK